MSHRSAYDPVDGIIVTTFSGSVDQPEIVAMFREVIPMARGRACYRWLHDFTAAERRLTTIEVYHLPRILAGMIVELGGDRHRLRRAIVGGQHMRDFVFAQDVAYNLGLTLRAFADAAAARTWLVSGVGQDQP